MRSLIKYAHIKLAAVGGMTTNNNIAVGNFAGCVKEQLMKGRRKFRIIILHDGSGELW